MPSTYSVLNYLMKIGRHR